MTIKAFWTSAALFAVSLVAGCGDGKDVDAPAAPSPEAVAFQKAEAERIALAEKIEAVDRELASGVQDPERREELLKEQTRLSAEVRKANQERLRRDREEVRRRILEKKKEVENG